MKTNYFNYSFIPLIDKDGNTYGVMSSDSALKYYK